MINTGRQTKGALQALNVKGLDATGRPFGVISVTEFGAKGGGIVDDTAAIQAAADACPTGGTVTGNGGTYLVSSIKLKSDMTFRDFNLLTLPTSTANSFYSPVTIGGYNDTTTRKNIRVRRVSVDGQRTKQLALTGPEDSGRHGFRIVGCVDNLLIEDCSARYCAADGIAFFSGSATRPVDKPGDTPLLTNVTMKNCAFEWNRRHGGSGDSLQYVTFDTCRFNYNGRDINGGVTEGDKGAVATGRYANGFDMEGYGVGSFVGDIVFSGCIAMQNVRSGITFYDPTDPTSPGFVARKNLSIINCVLDQGTEPSADNALTFSSTLGNKALGYVYKNVIVQGCQLKGSILLRSVDTVNITGGAITPGVGSTTLGTLDTCRNVTVGDTATGGKRFYVDTTNYTHQIRGERTLAPAEVFDLGLPRTITKGILRITLTTGGGNPIGGSFAADIFLDAGNGFTVHAIFGGTQIAANGAIDVIATNPTWQLKNVNANAYRIAYNFTGSIVDTGTLPNP